MMLQKATQRLTEVAKDRYTFELRAWENQFQKVRCKCLKCGYEWEASYKYLIHNKCGCPNCAGNIKITIEQATHRLTEVAKDRYTFELKEYKNSNQKIKCKCLKCGYEWEATYRSLTYCKSGCFKCRKPRSKYHKLDLTQTLQRVCEGKYTFCILCDKGSASRVQCKCNKCGHGWESNWNTLISQRTGCPRCIAKVKGAEQRFTQQEALQRLTEVAKDRYTFELKEYKNARQKVDCKCIKCGGVWRTSYSQLLYEGTGCPHCVVRTSRGEKQLAKFIKQAGFNIDESIKFGSQRELDIYCPEKHLAIEYNGVYWHSELNGRDASYHISKTDLCESKNIKLLQLFDLEYNQKRELCESVVAAHLGLATTKLHARKCEVKEITNKEARNFCDENHLQGGINSKVNIGAYYESKLVAVMTFSKPRYNKHYEWELLRFCSLKYHRINGIASKLLAFFKKGYEPTSIISYGNRRWCSKVNNVYDKMGFKMVGISKPNYFYVKGRRLFSRIEFQKHKLEAKLEVFDKRLSESENMKLNGYHRVWDCGNLIYEYLQQDKGKEVI